MGMSASQARFLSLTARKTNTEYEGQQINQQRTALSNESANYYSQLTAMSVPTPPSSADYSKITYTFKNGTESNTVTSLVATKETKDTGVYMLNYVQQIPEETMVVNGTSIVANNGTEDEPDYRIGGTQLQPVPSIPYTTNENNEPQPLTIKIYDDSQGAGKPTGDNTVYYGRNELRKRFIAAGIPEDVVNGYSDEELIDKIKVEAQYGAIAQEKYNDDNWYVMYRQNSSTNAYNPIMYSGNELSGAEYNEKTGLSLAGIKQYAYGESTSTKEIKNAKARVEQDASGRYISLFIYDNDEQTTGTKYDLTTTTEEDEAGYNNAMNQYFYNKAKYDQQIQEVNSKIAVIQAQDKNLELKLKQLDTEQNAISTEIDAVKKVISKNVESSFKTFSA